MADPVFFAPTRALTVAEIAAAIGAAVPDGADPARAIRGIAALDRAGPSDLAFIDNPRYADDLAGTRAGVCLAAPRFVAKVPVTTVALATAAVHRDLARVAGLLFPEALRPGAVSKGAGVSPAAYVDPAARLEAGATVEPMAVIGPGAEVGRGTIVCAGAAIGPQVRVGRDCVIGAGVSLLYALVGNRVIIHPGARIGQDGFGYVSGRDGHLKIPQIGRVIIQDNVEIGAGTTIDRGAIRDTVIGEGTKIDNLVQIGHNVVIGRHCLIVAQVGISGSATLGDFVVIGGQSGVNGHVTIGDGAQIAAVSTVHGDVPPGARWGGTPAGPIREWMRSMAEFRKLGRSRAADEDTR